MKTLLALLMTGLLGVVAEARRNGYYDLELDAIDLLHSSGVGVERYAFDVELHVGRICETAGVTRDRQRLGEIAAEAFSLRGMEESRGWDQQAEEVSDD